MKPLIKIIVFFVFLDTIGSVTITNNEMQILSFRDQLDMAKTSDVFEAYYDDEKNAMIAIAEKENNYQYEDFYEEMDNRLNLESSMNMIFFGPANSFLRLDTESLLHILQYTNKHKIPISRTLLAWDMVTDGKTAAYLQGREYLAFGTLLNVIPEEDLYNANFGDSTVLNFFANHFVNLLNRKYGVLVSAYRRYYGNYWYTNASYINNFGYMICGFPSYDLKLIAPTVLKDIQIESLQKLKRCSFNQTETLYKIATHPAAYGEPYTWTAYEVRKLGLLLTCIPKTSINEINLEAVAAITPDVLKMFDQSKLDYFSKHQVSRMNPRTRRIFILRKQLKSSFDIDQISSSQMYGSLIEKLIVISSNLLVLATLYKLTY